jgi:hypothetical protein
MKTKILFISILTLAIFTGCNQGEEFKDVDVTAVKQLYEPADGKYVVLQPSGALYFEWEQAYAADNSVVFYEILFDKENGDFSAPIYVISSDGRGMSTGASLTHKAINKVGKMAGGISGEEITLKWAIRSSRGLNFKLSEVSRKLTVVLLTGVDELEFGELLYIGGEGSEVGQQVKEIRNGNDITYEIYTKLEANKPFYFYSTVGGNTRYYALSDDMTIFGETSTVPTGVKVATTGQYRINLDFTSASVSIERINNVRLRISWTSAYGVFTYAGKGVWELKNYRVRLEPTGWGFDERYKFEFTVDGRQEDWGQKGPYNDNRQSINQASYFYMAPTANGQWDGDHFKFPTEVCDLTLVNLSRYITDITVYLTADRNYTHVYTNVKE